MLGAVPSKFTTIDVDAWLPALSNAVPVICRAAPSVETTTSAGVDAIRDSASDAVKETRTLLLNQPLAFGSMSVAAATVGGVRSILMPSISVTALVLPATSVHLPDAEKFVPSPANWNGPSQGCGPRPDP